MIKSNRNYLGINHCRAVVAVRESTYNTICMFALTKILHIPISVRDEKSERIHTLKSCGLQPDLIMIITRLLIGQTYLHEI